MTTRRVAVRREQVGGWPIFRELDLPSDLAAVSVEITRSLNQSIDHATGDASAMLGSSLAALAGTAQLKYWLVVVGAPVKRTDRVAAYKAHREKIWGALERQGIFIPRGPRRDLEVSLPDDSLRLIGSVELELDGLRAALNVTRLADAVCLATHSQADASPSLLSELAQFVGIGAPKLWVALVQMHNYWTFVARAFGEFDDRLVGVEVLAADALLDVLEPIMIAEVSSNSGREV